MLLEYRIILILAMYNNKFECSINIFAHDEGKMLNESLQSIFENIKCSKKLKSLDLNYEINLILDYADAETKSVATEWSQKEDLIKIHKVETGDLGLNKNFAVNISNFEYVAFLDADDIWGEKWLSNSIKNLIRRNFKNNLILHPSYMLYFGEKFELAILKNINYLNFLDMEIENFWPSSCLSKKSNFQKIKFKSIRELKINEFEDWEWNKDSLKYGLKNILVPNTCHFIRIRGNSYSKSIIKKWETNEKN